MLWTGKILCNSVLLYYFDSDEDTNVKAIVQCWLRNQSEEVRSNLSGWIDDYFYRALNIVSGKVSKIRKHFLTTTAKDLFRMTSLLRQA